MGEAELMFKCLDTDGSTRIEYSEFLAAVIPDDSKLQEDILRRTFARFDRNGDGQVCRGELLHVLGESCNASEIEDLLQDADTSGDGNLNFEEFLAYCTSIQKLPTLLAKRDVPPACCLGSAQSQRCICLHRACV